MELFERLGLTEAVTYPFKRESLGSGLSHRAVGSLKDHAAQEAPWLVQGSLHGESKPVAIVDLDDRMVIVRPVSEAHFGYPAIAQLLGPETLSEQSGEWLLQCSSLIDNARSISLHSGSRHFELNEPFHEMIRAELFARQTHEMVKDKIRAFRTAQGFDRKSPPPSFLP